MLLAIATLVAVEIMLPAYFIYVTLRAKGPDKVAWLLKTVTGGAFILFLTLGGRWDWFSIYLRYLPAGLFAIALVLGYRRLGDQPLFAGRSGRERFGTGMAIFEMLLAIGMVALAVRGSFYASEPIRLSFPLDDGTYYVAQGGSSVAVNYHHPYEAQQFAVDLTELNAIGVRAQGIYPQKRDAYAIYGETVYSPCNGEVTEAIDTFAGQQPPEADSKHPAGNHLLISCQGATVLLAHLQQDSVLVGVGATVASGEPLARVGNTGNTDEPHLHIHAVADAPGGALEGEGVPILLDGKVPVRNTLFHKSQ